MPTSGFIILTEGIWRDMKRWRRERQAVAHCPPYIPPPVSTTRWVVVEISNVTGSVQRYWRGTDRDHWVTQPDKARMFMSDLTANRAAEEHLLDIYRPSYAVVVVS
jgi:hypothetical protein